MLAKLETAFPKARIRVRLDGGFGNPEVLDFLDAAGVEYVVGLQATQPLKKRARWARPGACHANATRPRRSLATRSTRPSARGRRNGELSTRRRLSAWRVGSRRTMSASW